MALYLIVIALSKILYLWQKGYFSLKKNVYRYAKKGKREREFGKFITHGSYVRYGMLRIRITKRWQKKRTEKDDQCIMILKTMCYRDTAYLKIRISYQKYMNHSYDSMSMIKTYI